MQFYQLPCVHACVRVLFHSKGVSFYDTLVHTCNSLIVRSTYYVILSCHNTKQIVLSRNNTNYVNLSCRNTKQVVLSRNNTKYVILPCHNTKQVVSIMGGEGAIIFAFVGALWHVL